MTDTAGDVGVLIMVFSVTVVLCEAPMMNASDLLSETVLLAMMSRSGVVEFRIELVPVRDSAFVFEDRVLLVTLMVLLVWIPIPSLLLDSVLPVKTAPATNAAWMAISAPIICKLERVALFVFASMTCPAEIPLRRMFGVSL